MELIKNNPFRIAGVLSNASARELERQKAKMTAFAKVGKEAKSEYDFENLGEISRVDITLIEKAFSDIEQNQDRVKHALFWFLNINAFDNTAIEYLKNGNSDKAIEIWGKVTDNRDVNQSNFSAFNNLGSLKLLSSYEEEIKEGIKAKIELIESDYFEDFVHTVADETYTIDSDKQIEKFIDELLIHLNSQYPREKTIELFDNCNGSAQSYLLRRFTKDPIYKIESQIESSKTKRKDKKIYLYEIGLNLYLNNKNELSFLESLLGINDLKYKMIADNLAKEIMQCGIDYFNKWKKIKDPNKDPCKDSLNLLNCADSITVNSQLKDRIKENKDGIEEWAKFAPIQEDIFFITEKLKTFQNQTNKITNAKSLLNSCRQRLDNIKNVLGVNNELYLNISSAVVNNALGMIIEEVNKVFDKQKYNNTSLAEVSNILISATELISEMNLFNMNTETRERYSDNKSIIIKNKKEVEASFSNSYSLESLSKAFNDLSKTQNTSSNDGCYIGTMAYGDYDHPQVLELRKFRDGILDKTILGRAFIKLYYKYSPRLVNLLKDKKQINHGIRKILDQFILLIKK